MGWWGAQGLDGAWDVSLEMRDNLSLSSSSRVVMRLQQSSEYLMSE